MELDLDLVDEPIRILCSAGHVGSVPERYAGRKVRCRRCSEVLRVPREEVIDFEGEGYDAPRSRSRRAGNPDSIFAGRNKQPLIAGVVALVLLASTGLTMAVSGWRPWATDPLNFVPKSMDVVAQIDLERLQQEVPQVHDWFQQVKDRQQKKIGKMVFDPHSIRRVVVAGNMANGGTDQILVLIETTGFDINQLKNAREAKTKMKLTTKKHRGETYYTFEKKLPAGQVVAAYVISPTLIALGVERSVKDVIDIDEGKAPSIRKNRDLAPLLANTNDQLFWLAAVVDGKARDMTKGSAELHSVKVGFDYRGALGTAALTGAAQFASSEDAQKGEKMVKEGLKQLEPKREGSPAVARGVMTKFEGLITGTSLDTTGELLEARVDFDVPKIKKLLSEADEMITAQK